MLVDIKNELLSSLGLNQNENTKLDILLDGESKYLKDLLQNYSRVERSAELTAKEQALLSYAVAANGNHERLQIVFAQKARAEGAPETEIAEALACASLLSANNVLYRFRHYMDSNSYNRMPAGLRMNVKNDPIMGEELFELISTIISVINGCELCVEAHEATLRTLGTSEKKIWAAVRLSGVVTSLCKVI